MKVIKFLLKLVLFLVVLLVAALLTMPLWFGPVVKTVANSAVPGVVKTGFRIGHLSLNPYTARFELGDMQLYNPEGYKEKFAVTLGEVAFDAETASLATDAIHIEEIKIKDVFVSYLDGGPEKVNNFLQIQYNVAGGKEKYEAAQAEKKAKPKADDESKSEKRFIIDRLEISGLVIQLGPLPIRQPLPIVLKDIGRESGGATWTEVRDNILNEIMKAAGKVGDMLKSLGGTTGDAAKRLGRSAADLGKSTGDLGKKTADGIGKATGDGVKAVGDGAKKALDSLKGLW